jgi:hypothetical protein
MTSLRRFDIGSISRKLNRINARIGVRNDPKNSARKQKIFGYNMVLSTSVEVDLKLPVAVVNMAGNGKRQRRGKNHRPDQTDTRPPRLPNKN